MKDCVFCQPITKSLSGSTYGALSELTPDRLIIAETPSFFCLLDIAPIMDDHCLIITKQHISSFSEITVLSQWQEFYQLLHQITESLHMIYRIEPSLFEHGNAPPSVAPSCCITHAHIHVVPTDDDLSGRIASDGYQEIASGRYEDVRTLIGGEPYLYYKHPAGTGRYYDASRMPSQYLRGALAESLGVEFCHWQDYIWFANQTVLARRLRASHHRFQLALRLSRNVHQE